MSRVARLATGLRLAARGTARRRLFCLPYAGGGAGAYRMWQRAATLPEDLELIAVQLPGRETRLREPSFDAIEDIVEAVLPLVLAEPQPLPFALFGHSMGALVAYELARRLEADGEGPAHLFASSRRSPDEVEDEPPVHRLPEPEFLDELQRRYGAIPEQVRREPELLALLLPALRADLRAIEEYAHQGTTKLRCAVHVYGGTEDRHPRPAQLAGWQRVADGPVRVRLFAGDHFYLTAQRDALLADFAERWPSAVPIAAEVGRR